MSVSVWLFSGQIPCKNRLGRGRPAGEVLGALACLHTCRCPSSVSWLSHGRGRMVCGAGCGRRVLGGGAMGRRRIKGGQKGFRVFTTLQSEMLLGRGPHLPPFG